MNETIMNFLNASLVLLLCAAILAVTTFWYRQRETDLFKLKVGQAKKLKWKKAVEVSSDGEEAPFTKRSVRFTRGREEAVLWHSDMKVSLVRLDVPFEFDDFLELEEFLAAHPREADLDNATGETKYLREIEACRRSHAAARSPAGIWWLLPIAPFSRTSRGRWRKRSWRPRLK